MTEPNNRNMVEICPIFGTRKNDRIKKYQDEKNGKTFHFAKHYSEKSPDVCIGNCEQCKAWKLSTEKELYIRDNETFINRLVFNLSYIFAYFFSLLPITIAVGYFIDHNFRIGIFLSLLFAMFIHWLLHDRTDRSFEKWLGEKYDKEQNYSKLDEI